MKENLFNKKTLIICAVVLIAIIATVITAVAVNHNNSDDKETVGQSTSAHTTEEESAVSEKAAVSTTKKQTDYSSIEADLKKYAFGFTDAKMSFRESDSKIYYSDSENAATTLFRFNPKKSEKEAYLEIPSAKTYGKTFRSLVKLCEKGVIVEYCSDDMLEGDVIPDYYFYARSYKGKKDISKNVNEYSDEFDGEEIYIANNEDSSVECVEADAESSSDREYCFQGFMYLPRQLNEYYLEQVFTEGDEVFGIFCGGENYDKYQLVHIEDRDELEIIGEISDIYYIADKTFYFCKDTRLFSINLESDDFKIKDVMSLNCDVLYFVTKDRAYFCKYQSENSAEIFYVETATGKIQKVASDSFQTTKD
ncbi:MAG: hypothetical protein IJR70_04920 [Eubacterium sp.]|nr:hypothetical protein [Eubacterium sp.]